MLNEVNMYKIYEYNYIGFEEGYISFNGKTFCRLTANKGFQKFLILFNLLETDMFYKWYDAKIIKNKKYLNKNLIKCIEKIQNVLTNFQINMSEKMLIENIYSIRAEDRNGKLFFITNNEEIDVGNLFDNCFIKQFNDCISEFLIPLIRSLKY